MVTVIVISGGTATGDPEPTLKEMAAAAVECLEDECAEQAEPWPDERREYDWPKPITVCEGARVGRSDPGRLNEVCGRYPSGFK